MRRGRIRFRRWRVGDNGWVLAGAQLWSFATGGGVVSSPAVANGVVHVGSGYHNLYAFDLAGGLAAPARPSRSSLHPNYNLRQQQ